METNNKKEYSATLDVDDLISLLGEETGGDHSSDATRILDGVIDLDQFHHEDVCTAHKQAASGATMDMVRAEKKEENNKVTVHDNHQSQALFRNDTDGTNHEIYELMKTSTVASHARMDNMAWSVRHQSDEQVPETPDVEDLNCPLDDEISKQLGEDNDRTYGSLGEFGTRLSNFLTSSLFNKSDEDDDFQDQLPQDSFSLMMVSRFCCSATFGATLLVFAVQVGVLVLMAVNLTHKSSSGDGNPFGIPANVTPAVRGTQFVLLGIAVLSQDAVRTAAALIFKGYSKSLDASFPFLSSKKFIISVLMRITEGGLGVAVTFILIVSASDVIDLLLNFTGK